MPRDLADEFRLAAEGMEAASVAYKKAIEESKRRIRVAREWLDESRRRLVQAEAAIERTKTGKE